MELLIRAVVVGAWCGEKVACEVGVTSTSDPARRCDCSTCWWIARRYLASRLPICWRWLGADWLIQLDSCGSRDPRSISRVCCASLFLVPKTRTGTPYYKAKRRSMIVYSWCLRHYSCPAERQWYIGGTEVPPYTSDLPFSGRAEKFTTTDLHQQRQTQTKRGEKGILGPATLRPPA